MAACECYRRQRVLAYKARARREDRTKAGGAVVPLHPKTGEPRKHTSSRNYEALLRTITDTGRRVGEVLALERAQLVDGVFHFDGTGHEGEQLPAALGIPKFGQPRLRRNLADRDRPVARRKPVRERAPGLEDVRALSSRGGTPAPVGVGALPCADG